MSRTLEMHHAAVLSLALALAGCGGGGTGTSSSDPVTITDADFALIVGETRQLAATAPGSGAITWRSTAPAVASVSATGLATGVAVGDARLIASRGERADTVNVRVLPGGIVSIRMSATRTLLKIGDTIRVVAEPLDAQGRVIAGATPVWASSDSSRARVTPFGLVLGINAPGNVTISATVGNNVGSLTFTTATPAIGRIEVTPDSLLLAPGRSFTFDARVFDEFGGRDSTQQVTWSVFPAGSPVGTIDQGGRFTATADGRVTVRAAIGNVVGTAEVEVDALAAARFRIEVTNHLDARIEVLQNGVPIAAVNPGSVAVIERPLTANFVFGWSLVRPQGRGVLVSETAPPIADPQGTVAFTVDNVLDDGRVLWTPHVRTLGQSKPTMLVRPLLGGTDCECGISPVVPVNRELGYYILDPASELRFFATPTSTTPLVTIPVRVDQVEARTGIVAVTLTSLP